MSPSDKEVRPKIVDQGVPKAQASTSPAMVASKGTSNVMPRANWADTTRDCILIVRTEPAVFGASHTHGSSQTTRLANLHVHRSHCKVLNLV